MSKFCRLLMLALLAPFTTQAASLEQFQNGTGCPDDYYVQANQTPFGAGKKLDRFYHWMFGTGNPEGKIYKGLLKPYFSKYEKFSKYENFSAFIYASKDIQRQINLEKLHLLAWVGVNTIVKFKDSVLGEPPEKEWNLQSSKHNRNRNPRVLVFIENGLPTNEFKKAEQYVESLVKPNSPETIAETFKPEENCRIVRQRKGYDILATFGVVAKQATLEDAARCSMTAIMLNYGFSNAEEIFRDKDLVLAELEGSTIKYAFNPEIRPQSLLYQQIEQYKVHYAPQALEGGENICQTRNAWFRVEATRCVYLKKAILDKAFDYPVSDDQRKRCMALNNIEIPRTDSEQLY